MRAMSLDVGTKRIGVALTDPLCIFAQPLSVIERKDMFSDCKLICQLVQENDITNLIFGVPHNDEGEVIHQAKYILDLKTKVEACLKQKCSNVVVETIDETMTTRDAHEELKAAGVKHSKRKSVIDKVAAVMILRDWLEGRR